MPRFAILAHDFPIPHWDLFLESGASLRSWRLLAPLESNTSVPAELVSDHRLDYLDYEGPVSGGRGTVRRLDGGQFIWERDGPDQFVATLSGTRFAGRLTLIPLHSGWTCTFQKA